VKIVLVTDTHLNARIEAFNDNWNIVRRWIAAAPPDLVVNLGDITADGAGDLEELEAARGAFDDLGCAVRFVPGNHDIGDNPIAPGKSGEHPLNLDRLADYRRIFGPDYWSLDAGRWQIVALNAQLFGTDTAAEEQQRAWLDERLAEHDGPLGVLIHKPLFRNLPSDTEAHVRYVPHAPRQVLLDALSSRDLRFVACGHTHQARHLRVGDVDHVWTPSTAFCLPDAMQERIGGKTVGVVTLTLNDDGHHRFEFVTPDGLVRHNLLDHPAVYPSLAALRERLGLAAALN
jgi:3',5'-cyclic AMP phosphodiesterase CpdA